MTGCADCARAARNWAWGGISTSCEGCAIRWLANQPKHGRRETYQRAAGTGNLDQLKAAVSAEYQRIQKLRAGAATPS